MFRLAIEHVNADPTILPNKTLSFTAVDSGGQESSALGAAMSLVTDPDVIGLIGTAYSSTLPAPAMYSSHMIRPIISPGSTSPSLVNKRGFLFAMRIVASEYNALVGLLVIAHSFGWRHVAAIGTSGAFGDAMFFLLSEQCARLNISVVTYATHPRNPSAREAQQAACAIRDSRVSLPQM